MKIRVIIFVTTSSFRLSPIFEIKYVPTALRIKFTKTTAAEIVEVRPSLKYLSLV